MTSKISIYSNPIISVYRHMDSGFINTYIERFITFEGVVSECKEFKDQEIKISLCCFNTSDNPEKSNVDIHVNIDNVIWSLKSKTENHEDNKTYKLFEKLLLSLNKESKESISYTLDNKSAIFTILENKEIIHSFSLTRCSKENIAKSLIVEESKVWCLFEGIVYEYSLSAYSGNKEILTHSIREIKSNIFKDYTIIKKIPYSLTVSIKTRNHGEFTFKMKSSVKKSKCVIS